MPITIATRGSALALAQAHMILAQCRAAFPSLEFQIKIIKTTGDKLQTASLANPELPKGLFTKELEVALLNGQADLAVHSLKDLPTDLPAGLTLGAAGKRADVRDVLIYRDASFSRAPSSGSARRGFGPHLTLADLPADAIVATSSTRRRAQLLARRPDLRVIPIRGNVPTRLKKVAELAEMDATVLAAAGLHRLHYQIGSDGKLTGPVDPPQTGTKELYAPEGLCASHLALDDMLPCVGQAAIGIEIRAGDERVSAVCQKLNDAETFQCVTAERAFLKAMGGGCQLAVAAYAEPVGGDVRMRAVSFLSGKVQRTEGHRPAAEAAELGRELANRFQGT
jgi:hydroxymethylbilane synthase